MKIMIESLTDHASLIKPFENETLCRSLDSNLQFLWLFHFETNNFTTVTLCPFKILMDQRIDETIDWIILSIYWTFSVFS